MAIPKTAYWSLNYRRRKFVDLYIATNFSGRESVIKSGFKCKHPDQYANELLRNDTVAGAIEERLAEFRNTLRMESEEVMERLTSVGRDPHHKDHVRALELMAKIHGLLSEKLSISIDRQSLLDAIDQETKRLTAGVVDAELIAATETKMLIG